MTYRCAYCGITTDGYSNHVHTCASAPWLKMPNDDPCDALPDEHAQWLWTRVMLDRETDPDARRLIKFGMNQRYGKSRYGEAIALAFGIVNDPHDEWPRGEFYVQSIGRAMHPIPIIDEVRTWKLLRE